MNKKFPYCTLSDVQNEISNVDNNVVHILHDCIRQATTYIDNYCRRSFQPLVFTEEKPFVALSPMVSAKRAILPFNIRKIVRAYDREGDLEIDPAFVGTRRVRFTREIRQPLTLVGEFGSESPPDNDGVPDDVPPAIRRACCIIAATFSTEYRRERIGFDGSKVDIEQSAIPSEAFALLKMYVSNVATKI